jgi:hypothetical protein
MIGPSDRDTRRERALLRARRGLIRAALDRGEANADDAFEAARLPADLDPRCLGAVPGPLAQAGVIRRVGYSTQRRAGANGRPAPVWAIENRAAAIDWLSTHPDPGPEPGEPPAAHLFSLW